MGLDPTTIGRYVVLGTLGQGAMGTVYLGEDPMLKRGVALKVVHAGQAQGREQALSRFRREAEISARLNHPNVITVFDVGDEEGVGPFLAMEFIEGETLDTLVRQGPLAPPKAMEVLLQAGSALDAAHAIGIVHRDVKPANLMVAKDGRVKLMDFGIAKEEEKNSTTGALLCTPGYAAPELLDGASATAATDRWAFAVTAYECLAGRPPFDGENISVVLYNVAHGEPVFPGDLDPGLEAVFRKAMAKAPADRHPDLKSLLTELLAALPLEAGARRRFSNHLQATPEGMPAQAPAAATLPDVPGEVAPGQAELGLTTLGQVASKPANPRRVRLLAWTAGAVAAGGLLFLGWWNGFLLPRHLHVESEPSGAWVFVDGSVAARTPALDLRIPQRAGSIRLELEGYYPYPYSLTPTDSALRLKLSPRYLRLDLDSRPSGASVFVDGKPLGKTPLRGLRIPNVPRGTPMLVKKDGVGSWAASVNDRNPPPPLVILSAAKDRK